MCVCKVKVKKATIKQFYESIRLSYKDTFHTEELFQRLSWICGWDICIIDMSIGCLNLFLPWAFFTSISVGINSHVFREYGIHFHNAEELLAHCNFVSIHLVHSKIQIKLCTLSLVITSSSTPFTALFFYYEFWRVFFINTFIRTYNCRDHCRAGHGSWEYRDISSCLRESG